MHRELLREINFESDAALARPRQEKWMFSRASRGALFAVRTPPRRCAERYCEEMERERGDSGQAGEKERRERSQ